MFWHTLAETKHLRKARLMRSTGYVSVLWCHDLLTRHFERHLSYHVKLFQSATVTLRGFRRRFAFKEFGRTAVPYIVWLLLVLTGRLFQIGKCWKRPLVGIYQSNNDYPLHYKFATSTKGAFFGDNFQAIRDQSGFWDVRANHFLKELILFFTQFFPFPSLSGAEEIC